MASEALTSLEGAGATRTPSPRPKTHSSRRVDGVELATRRGIIGSQKTLRLQDPLILATDTESLHPDIDTDIVLSTDFSEIHPWLVVWHGNEIPVLQYLHDHNHACYKEGHRTEVRRRPARRSRAASTSLRGCRHLVGRAVCSPPTPRATPAADGRRLDNAAFPLPFLWASTFILCATRSVPTTAFQA